MGAFPIRTDGVFWLPNRKDCARRANADTGGWRVKGRSVVLLVDDNDAGQMLARALLKHAGMSVDSSGSAVEARKRTTKPASPAFDSKRTRRRP